MRDWILRVPDCCKQSYFMEVFSDYHMWKPGSLDKGTLTLLHSEMRWKGFISIVKDSKAEKFNSACL